MNYDEKDIVTLRQDYAEGKIDKHIYLETMLKRHEVLRHYSRLLDDSTLSELRITSDGVVAVSRRYGVLHKVVFEDVSNIPLTILDTGDYESKEIEFILRLIKSGDCIFDIGANTGWVSMHIARKEPTVTVYAFEPIPSISSILEQNMNLNGLSNIRLIKIALSDSSGDAEFYFNYGESGATSMRNIRETQKAVKISVPTERLDDFVRKNKIAKLDFIKCDVEGAELFVLRGGLETIKQHKPIILAEMLRKWAAKFNYHPDEIISMLGQHGFACYALEDEKLSLLTSMDDSVMTTNFFFIHDERKCEVAKFIQN